MTKKDDLPSMPFYWGEWFKSLDVQALPRWVRCVWFEMLGRMWDSSERGYLTINGKPLEAGAKASALGFGDATDKYLEAEKILEDYGIFSRRESDQAIYSRFILKLVEIREKKRKAGSKGGIKTQAGAKAGAYESAKANPEDETENNLLKKDQKIKDKILDHFAGVHIPESLNRDDLIEEIVRFFKFRDEAMSKPLLSSIEIESFLKKLNDVSGRNPDVAIEILNNSIVSKWSGIYALDGARADDPQKANKPSIVKKFGVTECPKCKKNEGFMVVSERKKWASFQCKNPDCLHEFEVKLNV